MYLLVEFLVGLNQILFLLHPLRILSQKNKETKVTSAMTQKQKRALKTGVEKMLRW